MLDNIFKGLLVGLGCVVAVWAMVAMVRGAKRGGAGAAMLGVFLTLFGSSGPPPHQETEEARKSKDKRRSEDHDGDDDGPDGGELDSGHDGHPGGD